MSPSVGESKPQAFSHNPAGSDDMGPQDDFIDVKVYFYGEDKALRTKVFPPEM